MWTNWSVEQELAVSQLPSSVLALNFSDNFVEQLLRRMPEDTESIHAIFGAIPLPMDRKIRRFNMNSDNFNRKTGRGLKATHFSLKPKKKNYKFWQKKMLWAKSHYTHIHTARATVTSNINIDHKLNSNWFQFSKTQTYNSDLFYVFNYNFDSNTNHDQKLD